jgi:subtilisin family serine protease
MVQARFVVLACVTLTFGCVSSSSGSKTTSSLSAPDLAKIDWAVLESLNEGGRASLILHLGEKADLSGAEGLDWKSRGRFVFNALRATAARAQVDALDLLSSSVANGDAASIEPLWICNCIVVWNADEATVATTAERPDIEKVVANRQIKVIDDEPVYEGPRGPLLGPEWNIQRIRADQVWQALGITGNGVTVASMDTGVAWTHPALQAKYRGWDGSVADHNYNWYDATRAGSRVPVDTAGHGTHTMGTIVGDDGAGNQIGVAPGARWISVSIIDSGATWIDAAHRGFQWLIAPTDLDGNNPDPNRRPSVVNNSWGCNSFVSGCAGYYEGFRDDVVAWIAAGIFPEFSAGNEGPAPMSMRWPASYVQAFSTGATDINDNIADFSSRGPSIEGVVKPEVVAPGNGIRSSFPSSGYLFMSGTSMAGPHVVGTVALMLEANPNLGIVDLTNILEMTAIPFGDPIPNNTYGWGRIDAFNAVQVALGSGPSPR